ncbi:hypothetical protein HFN49_00045 [Rhizobium leguminosarum]|uniref:hypothetical protein n=1 Tax=Rhizobium ruizarguesonis TaxID=2081791 RepID=UPI001A98AC82|nr:hypothetical protein [Rhizobium ruizarguesonis]MBY5884591.1 hypothetical protein [Rhizobium leguminosarum]QSZ05155.1 hypothetical protein J3P73_31605 [Rhizobium ruizarguesonis]
MIALKFVVNLYGDMASLHIVQSETTTVAVTVFTSSIRGRSRTRWKLGRTGQKQLKVEKMIVDEQLAKAGIRLADALNKVFAPSYKGLREEQDGAVVLKLCNG